MLNIFLDLFIIPINFKDYSTLLIDHEQQFKKRIQKPAFLYFDCFDFYHADLFNYQVWKNTGSKQNFNRQIRH